MESGKVDKLWNYDKALFVLSAAYITDEIWNFVEIWFGHLWEGKGSKAIENFKNNCDK